MSLAREEIEAILMHAQRMAAERAATRVGLVSSYDPTNYCVKVRLQPEDAETGWLPLLSPWVGNGWGLFAPPTTGDMIEVHFQEGDTEAGFACQRFFNDSDRPLTVQSGEFWLVHKSGSLLKFHNDGSIEMTAATNLTASAPNGTLRLAGKNVQIHATQSYSWDSGGYGEKWTATGSPNLTHYTWQIGAVITAVPTSINPPEGP